MARDVQ